MPDFLGKKESDKVVRIQPKYINLKSSKKLSSHGQPPLNQKKNMQD